MSAALKTRIRMAVTVTESRQIKALRALLPQHRKIALTVLADLAHLNPRGPTPAEAPRREPAARGGSRGTM
jgi:hypothetical protein